MLDHLEPAELGWRVKQGGLWERCSYGRRNFQPDDLAAAGEGHEAARVHRLRREQGKAFENFLAEVVV